MPGRLSDTPRSVLCSDRSLASIPSSCRSWLLSVSGLLEQAACLLLHKAAFISCCTGVLWSTYARALVDSAMVIDSCPPVGAQARGGRGYEGWWELGPPPAQVGLPVQATLHFAALQACCSAGRPHPAQADNRPASDASAGGDTRYVCGRPSVCKRCAVHAAAARMALRRSACLLLSLLQTLQCTGDGLT